MDNPDAQKIIADYERFGQKVPDSLIEPELFDVEWMLWDAFLELSTERQMGMRAGPIPASKINGYAGDMFGMDRATFMTIIRKMDEAYLNHESGQSKTFSREMLRG